MTDAARGPVRERSVSAQGQDLCVFLVAGEHSGDSLGGKLMEALNKHRRGRCSGASPAPPAPPSPPSPMRW